MVPQVTLLIILGYSLPSITSQHLLKKGGWVKSAYMYLPNGLPDWHLMYLWFQYHEAATLGIFLLPPGCLSIAGLPPYITHLYTWVEGGTVRVKCLTMYLREHNVTGHDLNPDHLMQSQVH